MDLRSIIQTKRFRRIHKKYPVSLELLQANALNIIKFLKYAISLRVIIKRTLIVSSDRRVFIKSNVLSKNLLSRTKKKHKRLLPWRQQMILYLKKNYKLEKVKLLNALADYNSDSTNESCEKTNLNPEEIQAQLKAQLVLLNNKKSVPLLRDASLPQNAKSSNLSELSKTIFSRTNSFNGPSNNISNTASRETVSPSKVNEPQGSQEIPTNRSEEFSEQVNGTETESANTVADAPQTIDEIDKNLKAKDISTSTSKKSFIDSLMNKICITSKNETLVENESDKTSNSQKSIDDDSDTGDFFKGFSASDIENHPALLPTPIVPQKNKAENSAFVSSEDLDKFFKDNSLKASPIKLPILKKIEQGMISKNSVPPKLSKPAREINLIKPRTVAEKRLILQKGRNYKYFMIENENTIYRELKRRSKGSRPINLHLIRHVQGLKVPSSRDLWKAMSWLSTETNNYYFQNIVIDRREVKLICGPGNYKSKYLPETSSFLERKITCSETCKDKQIFSLIRIRQKEVRKPKDELKPTATKKLNIANTSNKMRKLPTFKPGPLSSKCIQMKKLYDHPGCGTADLHTLPEIQLEVFPKINHPLDNYIRGYLKLILPSKNITREWAEFSVSTLISNQNEDEEAIKSFTFTIPYQNNEKKILVRRLLNRKEIYDDSIELEFRKNIDLNNKLEVECADILSGMIECVGLSLGEDSLIKNDPDTNWEKIEEVNCDVPKTLKCLMETKHKLNHNASEEPPIKKLKKTNPKTRLLLELKRLNATIIDAAASSGQQLEDKLCNKDFCKMGCICNSIKSPNIVRNHCQKEGCIFECTCLNSSMDQEMSKITSEDALILRQKATARLARMEREFTSTVVLTNNETVLINESQLERKRRCTQRFLNYSQDNSDDEKPKHSNRKKRLVSTNTKSPIKEAKIPSLEDITYVSDETFKSLKHCSLDLVNLELGKFQKWCMVHCLYNCFCKCRDTEGKPFILKKENIPQEQENIVVSRKPRYSFDKHEAIDVVKTNVENKSIKVPDLKVIKNESLKTEVNGKLETNSTEKDCDKIEILPILNTESYERKKRRRRRRNNKQLVINEMSEKLENIRIKNVDEINNKNDFKQTSDSSEQLLQKELIILDKYTKQDSDVICRRVIRIPQVYKWRNKRAEHVSKRLTFPENGSTNIILNNRIQKSSLYRPRRPVTKAKESLLKSELMNQIRGNKIIGYIDSTRPDLNDSISNNNSNTSTEDQGFLKISSVVSLGAQNLSTQASTSGQNKTEPKPIIIADINSGVKNNELDYNTNLLQTSPAILIPDIDTEIKSKSDNILNVLNYTVTKTMHNICQIQLKETKHIPAPAPEQLFISQWRHFRQAYKEGIIQVWEVQIENARYFTATMEFIPLIRNAFSVVNIKAIPLEKLPLFGKMLSSQFTNSNCSSLSILMAGREDHWKIIGMTKASLDYIAQGGVIKPTPQSHPWLSKKINKLYEYMAKQHFSNAGKRIVENQRRLREAAALREKLKMNISIRKLSEQDIQRENLIVPLTSEKNDHKWLILDIADDFSHILFLNTVTWLSVNKIKIAFQRSQIENKMVRLPRIDGNSLDCYITKSNKSRIYLGPYPMDKDPAIVLFQCVNGKMLIREHYEQKFKRNNLRRTNGFWLCFKNGKIMYDLNANSVAAFSNGFKSTIQPNPASSLLNRQNQLLTVPSSDILLNQATRSSVPISQFGFNNWSQERPKINMSTIKLPLDPNRTPLMNNSTNPEMKKISTKEDAKVAHVNFFEINSKCNKGNTLPTKVLNITNDKLIQMKPGNYEINSNTNTLSNDTKVLPTSIVKSSFINDKSPSQTSSFLIGPKKGPFIIPNQNYEIKINQSTVTDPINRPVNGSCESNFSKSFVMKPPTNTSSYFGINSIVSQANDNSASIVSNTDPLSVPDANMSNNSKFTNYAKKTETCTKLVGNPQNFGKIKVVNINNFINTNSCAIELSSSASEVQHRNRMSCNADTLQANLNNDAKRLQEDYGIRIVDENDTVKKCLEDEVCTQNMNGLNSTLYPQKSINFENKNAITTLPNTFVETKTSHKSSIQNSSVLIKNHSILNDSQSIHGYFLSDLPEYPKFGGVKRNSNYLIRLNRDSCLQVNTLTAVSQYLNRHVKKHNSKIYKPTYYDKQWIFKPSTTSTNAQELSPHNVIKKMVPNQPMDTNECSKSNVKNEPFTDCQTKGVIIIEDD